MSEPPFLNFSASDFLSRTRLSCADMYPDLGKFMPATLSILQSRTRCLIYKRNPLSAIAAAPVESKQTLQFDDYYNDRSRFLSKKAYRASIASSPPAHRMRSELSFDSQFECGNLLRVYKHTDREYVLLLQPDTGTKDYSHWFYFSVKNSLVGEYRFHLVNMMRPEPLIEEGLKPAVWSTHAFEESGIGWTRGGSKVRFSETEKFQQYLNEEATRVFYTLSFTYAFGQPGDTVYFAYAYPYSYSKLHTFLEDIVETHGDKVRLMPLTKTLGSNSCDCIVIGELDCDRGKPAIVVSGRVHPGETAASYAVHGLIDFLVSSDKEAEALRKSFVFYIVPMLNPDGVRQGNYRCSLIGVDLNRRWRNPNRSFHPTIFYMKQLLADIVEKHGVEVYCDFHGHSKKQNVFMYGCQRSIKDSKETSLLPSAFSQCFSSFSLTDTHYKIEKSKESTARIVVWKEFKVSKSYTLECSMFGRNRVHYTTDDYLQVGEGFAKSLLVLVKVSVPKPVSRDEKRSRTAMKPVKVAPKSMDSVPSSKGIRTNPEKRPILYETKRNFHTSSQFSLNSQTLMITAMGPPTEQDSYSNVLPSSFYNLKRGNLPVGQIHQSFTRTKLVPRGASNKRQTISSYEKLPPLAIGNYKAKPEK